MRLVTPAAIAAGTLLLVGAAGTWIEYLHRGGAGVVSASGLPLTPIRNQAANDYVNAHFFAARDIDDIGLGLADYIAEAAKPRTRANEQALHQIAYGYSRTAPSFDPYYGATRTFGNPDGAALGRAEAELTLGAHTLDRIAVELFAPTIPPAVPASTIARYRRGVAEWNTAVRTIWPEAGISKVEPPGWPLIGPGTSP